MPHEQACGQEQVASSTPPWRPGQRVTYLSHPSASLGRLVVEPLEATYLGPAPGGRVTIEVLIPGKRTRHGATTATRVQMRVLPAEIRE